MLEEEVLRDKCGVFGIWGVDDGASEYTYLGLHNLQHRGQGNCGIVTLPKKSIRDKRVEKFKYQYGKGIVNSIYSGNDLKKLGGIAAIGHVRYPTRGSSSLKNAQPFRAETGNGWLSVAHNGQFANETILRERLLKEGKIFRSTSDTEAILHEFSNSKGKTIEEKIKDSFNRISPSYSIVMLTENELIGIKDPFEVRPLCIGYLEQQDAYVLASESVALDIIGANFVGEVGAGEAIIIDDSGMRREQIFEPSKLLQRCIFEQIYFSRPDSKIFGEPANVSQIQKEFGKQLARECETKADLVIPVPDSGISAAMGYSEESGISFGIGLIRNHYIGRTFIEPEQVMIDADIGKKFNVDRKVIQDKKVVVVDDSIIRGSTGKKVMKLIKDAGAKEIHLRISSPPYVKACHLGIETSDPDRLIMNLKKSVEGVRQFMGVDSLKYLSEEGMLSNPHLNKSAKKARRKYCIQCFSGKEIIKKE